jgi:hypothetical protein
MSERDIRRLLALVEKHLGTSWLDIADWLKTQNSLDAIESRLLVGDYQGVIQEVESAARMFATQTHSAFIQGGQQGAEWLDSQLPDKLVRFDVKNDYAIRAAERNELELVRGLTQEVRETVHSIIIDGTRTSANPREMARDIRSSIGLTPTQDKAVRSYRQALEQQDWSNALSRELSSGQGDRTVRRLQRDGGSLSPKQVDSLVDRYRENALTWRAETIARTESSRNVHAGLEESFRQAVERGDVDAEQLVKEWIHAGRGKSRPDHIAMSGTTVKFGEEFEFPDGTRMKYPGDPRGGPEHVANCRCTIATTIASI